jgi:hypothetical protein
VLIVIEIEGVTPSLVKTLDSVPVKVPAVAVSITISATSTKESDIA